MIDKNSPTQSQGMDTETGKSGLIPRAAGDQLKNDAEAVLETARSEFVNIKNEATTQAGAIAEEAKAEVAKLADKAKGIAAEQKEFVAGQLEGVAEAVQKVAGELEASNANTAGYARSIADTVVQFSDTVKNKNVDELLSVAQDFGRRQPAIFMGAAALLGFAATRFLMASAQRGQPSSTGTSYGSGYGGTSSNGATSSSYRSTSGYGGTNVGDGGLSGSYGDDDTSPETPSSTTRNTMGGTI